MFLTRLYTHDGHRFDCVPQSSIDDAYKMGDGWIKGRNHIVRYEIWRLKDDGTPYNFIDANEREG